MPESKENHPSRDDPVGPLSRLVPSKIAAASFYWFPRDVSRLRKPGVRVVLASLLLPIVGWLFNNFIQMRGYVSILGSRIDLAIAAVLVVIWVWIISRNLPRWRNRTGICLTAVVVLAALAVDRATLPIAPSKPRESILLSCGPISGQTRVPAGSKLYLMDILGNKLELGLGTVEPQVNDFLWPLGWPSHADQISECGVTNFSSDAALNLEMTFRISLREVEKAGKSMRSGQVVNNTTDRIIIPSLRQDGTGEKFTFYMENSTKFFAEVTPPKSATVELVHSGKRITVAVLWPDSTVPIWLPPLSFLIHGPSGGTNPERPSSRLPPG